MTGNVHFAMSTALSFVNYTSHAVKACTRRNFTTYPINMHKIISTAAAMCLFDLIQNVMSLTTLEKSGSKS